MKRLFCLIFLCLICFSESVFAQTLRDTVWLAKDTHINYDLAAWDSVTCDIEQGAVLIEHIKLTMADSGKYRGIYVPTYSGNFTRHYYYWYEDDVMGEPESFCVLETTAFHGAAAGLDTTAIKAMHDNRGTSTFDVSNDYVLLSDGGGTGQIDLSFGKVAVHSFGTATLGAANFANAAIGSLKVDDSFKKMIAIRSDSGAVASVDSESVARSVWDDDIIEQSSRTVTASCAGSGARTVNIDVKNYADSVAISGFTVGVEDSSSGEFQGKINTDTNGRTTWSLDDETWRVSLQKTPWTITTPRYITVTGDATYTYYATEFTPSSPPNDSLCVVYGYIKKGDGSPYIGARVEIWMDAYPVLFQGRLVDVVTKMVEYTNSSGRFEFANGIYYSSSLTPSNLKWNVRVQTTNWPWEGQFTAPSQASWEIEIPEL